MSSFYTFGNVSGQNTDVAGFYNDGKAGRIDFLVSNLGNASVDVAVQERNVDGSNTYQLAAATIKPGGQASLACSSIKGVLALVSGSGNTGESYVRVDAVYHGTYGRGTLAHKERIAKTGFTGSDIPR